MRTKLVNYCDDLYLNYVDGMWVAEEEPIFNAEDSDYMDYEELWALVNEE